MNDKLYQLNLIKEKEDSCDYEVIIKIPLNTGWIEQMSFVIETDNYRKENYMKHIKNDDKYAYFSCTINLPTKALYYYYFTYAVNGQIYYCKEKNMDNNTSINREDMGKLSVNFKTPNWAHGAIMYHIFVDRFNKSKMSSLSEMPNRYIHDNWNEDVLIGPNENGRWNIDFFGGDIKGITEKLDYLKELGIDIIYLSPIVFSQSNHRYDTSDYEKVDPYAGNWEDLKILCEKAHQLGMKVILDAVFNHTGSDSKYFNGYLTFPNLGAYQSVESPYFQFFQHHFEGDKTIFNYWWGMRNLPVCDGKNPKWQKYIYGEGGIIDQWFSYGIDGLRLDVADELTDEFIEGIRKAVKRNKEDGFILGEVWKNPMKMGRGYLSSGKGMDSVMNYHLVNALIRYFKYGDVSLLERVIKEMIVDYPNDTINTLMNFTSTHDISRAINIFGSNDFNYYGEWAWSFDGENREWEKSYVLSKNQYELGKKVLMAYTYTLNFLPGILSIFYGDEVGLQGMGNLVNRRCFPWDRIDKELLGFFQKISRIRHTESFLKEASLEPIDINDKYLSFLRRSKDEELLVLVNRLNDKVDIKVPSSFQSSDVLYPLGESSSKMLDNYGGIVLKKVRK